MKNKSNNAAYALLKRRPIAVNPALIKLTGSHTAAIFLSQAIYWEETMDREFYKTNDDWQEELYMSEQVFTTARKNASKYISVVKKGLPARNFYKVNWDMLLEDLATLETEVSSQLENSPHQSPQKVGSLDGIESGVTITETTSKTTSKNKESKDSGAKASKEDEEQISVLYYKVIKELELPNPNNTVTRKKIKQMAKEISLEQAIWYLKFLQEHYETWEHKYKPALNESLDIYSKRKAIIDKLKNPDE